MEPLSTGMGPVDRELDGGLRPGSIVALLTPPKAQVDPLLRAFVSTRPTIYVSTLRSEATIREELDGLADSQYNVIFAGLDTPIDTVRRIVQRAEDEVNVVVDTVRSLEAIDDEARYSAFLTDFKNHLVNTDGLGILHCPIAESESPMRPVTLLHADVVFELEIRKRGDTLEYYLYAPKIRGGDVLENAIKLELGRKVSIDTSRDIA